MEFYLKIEWRKPGNNVSKTMQFPLNIWEADDLGPNLQFGPENALK